jgi:predicted PurR-regulated permease PerM
MRLRAPAANLRTAVAYWRTGAQQHAPEDEMRAVADLPAEARADEARVDKAPADEARVDPPELKVEPPEQPEMPIPSDPRTIFLGGLFFLAVLAALYAARQIALPIALAFTLKLLLQPGVRALERFWVPRPVGALCAIVLVFGLIFGLGAAISGPASAWATRLPEGWPRVEERLTVLKRPLDALQRMLARAEQAVQSQPARPPVVVSQTRSGIFDALIGGARDVVDGLFTTIIVLFFLLCSGDTFLRRLVEVLPTFGSKRQMVEISNQVEGHISAYLLTITLINAVVGAAMAGIAWVCGLSDPLLWGALAFFLNYVPILGPIVVMGVVFLAGFIAFDSLWASLMPGLLFLAVHLAEGEFITPTLLARRFTLNPVVVVIGFVFWYWMWGVPGAVLAVPMMAMIKIVCDQVPSLAAFGHFLEGERPGSWR